MTREPLTADPPLHGAQGRADDSAVLRSSLDEPERFGEIFDAYFAEIHGYAARRLGSDVASDVAAQTFLEAFRGRGRYDASRAAVRTWLYGIATNVIGKHRRAEVRGLRARARLKVVEEADGHADRVDDRVSAEGLRGRLAGAIAGLSDGDRDVLLLVALADLSHQEVAAALDIPYGTVGSRLNRARKKVREALGGTNPMRDLEDDHG
ncbi:RNA polymerase sigma-70 factor (ECF subfamily) [Actinomadura pelletieri DSM 43383]|uniref:RNA polymerase sigma-70 factor (ECF subfamily) n=1 Tax=Actinomadura pelletieri DSM 43383 TaxID=1120940 RepID=A0A495QZD6_9ACTN|nr:sigma-70 family RNA polymerase sigma factor [Actinomadura pelletieri]RKS79553.1 RNA polymerase sigma-70 factor (ECF subfamily) [Actinomadura pelletieri DSM 43383]